MSIYSLSNIITSLYSINHFLTESIDQIWRYHNKVVLKGNQDEFDFLTLQILKLATVYEVYRDRSL